MPFAFGPAWRLKTASLAIQISPFQDSLAASGAIGYWSQDPHCSHFSGAKADSQRVPLLAAIGLSFREGKAPPAVDVLLSFRAPPKEF